MRVCPKCNERECVGKTRYCRPCNAKYMREYRAKNPQTKEYMRNYMLIRNYGISFEEYDELCEDQADKCAICSIEPDVLHVDHNHETGEIRGLLCSDCNRGIGLLRDDPDVLEAAAKYLRNK